MKTTTSIKSAAIRKELKALGYNSKKVSVRTENYSMGSSINITIKDFSIDKTEIEEIANRYADVRRCEITGDILSGGNRFVFVDYDTCSITEDDMKKTRSAIIEALNYYSSIYCVCDLQDAIHINEKIKIDGYSLRATNLLMYRYTNINNKVLTMLIQENKAA